MKCNKKQVLGCYVCPLTSCEGLKAFTCVECMTNHTMCSWKHNQFDIRPYIEKAKKNLSVFCQKCEDRILYGVAHLCSSLPTKDWLDVMAELSKRELKG